MRVLFFLLSFLFLAACATTTSMLPTGEAGKQAEAEQLVRASLTERYLADVQQRTAKHAVAVLADEKVAPELAERIIAEEVHAVGEAEHQRLLDVLVPIYRRYYTAEEIHQLLSFYQTEVARKSLRVSREIAAEGQQFVQLWNGHFERELLKRIEQRLAREGVAIDR